GGHRRSGRRPDRADHLPRRRTRLLRARIVLQRPAPLGPRERNPARCAGRRAADPARETESTGMTEDVDIQDREAREAAARAADYEHGWSSEIETEFAPKGLNEDTVRYISAKKGEPEWMLDWRLKAFRLWQEMETPDWAKLSIPPIDYQDAYQSAAPKAKPKLASLDEVDPDILEVYAKLGIPIEEQKVLAGVEGARKVAVDAVFDSVSVATTFREELKRAGVIFLSISEA